MTGLTIFLQQLKPDQAWSRDLPDHRDIEGTPGHEPPMARPLSFRTEHTLFPRRPTPAAADSLGVRKR